jgi:hypothetical protein
MLERHFDAKVLNEIINRPDMRDDVATGQEGYLDCTAQLANKNNVALMGQYGGCVFIKLTPGIYEVHTQVVPEGRGPWALRMTEAAARWMFTRTDCWEIATRVPEGHVAARALTLKRGLKREFTRFGECRWRNKSCDVTIYSYRLQDWVGLDDGLLAIGRAFHDKLHEAIVQWGVVPHEDDENHNRYVGATALMAWAGQVQKGLQFYNRWALLARHPVVELKSTNPVRIAIDHDVHVTFWPPQDIEVQHASQL